MLAGIGIILIAKQIPLMLGYDEASFWTKDLFNSHYFKECFQSCKEYLLSYFEMATIIIAICFTCFVIAWKKRQWQREFHYTYFILVVVFVLCWHFISQLFHHWH
jgi:MFS superfamily sulfate permease-like transporter